MEDLLDVLNERGGYTGKVETREKCHKEGLWHKAVVLFIVNSNDEVLLQKRSANKKLWPNMWDVTSGGHVSCGEFGFEAAIREAKEEIGIDVEYKDMIFIGGTRSTNIKGDIINNHFNEYYVAIKDVDIKDFVLQPQEVSEVKWVSKEDIVEKIKNNKEGITDKEECWEYLIKFFEWKSKKGQK